MKHEASDEDFGLELEPAAVAPVIEPEPEPVVIAEPEPEPEPEPVVAPKLQGVLINKSATNFSIDIQTKILKSSARLRKAAPFVTLSISLTPRAAVDVKKLLNCSAEEALVAIRATPFITKLVHRGLLEII